MSGVRKLIPFDHEVGFWIFVLIWSTLLLSKPQYLQARDLSVPGQYGVGWRHVAVQRPDGSDFLALFYYPSSAEGQNSPVASEGRPFPGIAFGHGYLQPPVAYTSLYAHLASWGYFVIAPGSALSLFPDHERFASDLSAALTWLERENSRVESTIYQAVDIDRFGMSGHSMGGGASILATARDKRVQVLANLAAAETRPSAIDAMASIRVPTSLIAGSADEIVPIRNNAWPMYQNGHAPRLLPVIIGGYHCGFEDHPAFSMFCDTGGIDGAKQLAITRRLLTSFFELYLREDGSVWHQVWGLDRASDCEVKYIADSGMELKPRFQEKAGELQEVGEFLLILQNAGDRNASYDLFSEYSPWPVTIQPSFIPELLPGQAIGVQVQIFPDSDGCQILCTINATSGADGLTHQVAVISYQAGEE